SDIRLESADPPVARSDEGLLTEEINLDEELLKQELEPKPQAKVKPKSKLPKFPQSSPFELSESGLNLGQPPAPAPAAPEPTPPAGELSDSSSDYELTVPGAPTDSSEDFSLELPDDSDLGLDLGEAAGGGHLSGPSSGISLGNPVDSGISLEEKSEEFELSLDLPTTPKPAAPAPEDSDSEFELSLDVDDSSGQQVALPSDSDSEFELTLDDAGGLAEEEAPAKSKDRDIFETDFEVPALEDDSGSEVAALDTDLDSAHFDVA